AHSTRPALYVLPRSRQRTASGNRPYTEPAFCLGRRDAGAFLIIFASPFPHVSCAAPLQLGSPSAPQRYLPWVDRHGEPAHVRTPRSPRSPGIRSHITDHVCVGCVSRRRGLSHFPGPISVARALCPSVLTREGQRK
ncbi:hypothetical protein B0H13DRAFT_2661946, partial [Mycena leptocephala]